MQYKEERLSEEKHFREVADFQCGPDDPLNRFLTDESFKYDTQRYGTTYLLKESVSNTILAFYTITANGVQTYDSVSHEYNAVPVIEIARIAVEYDFQDKGLGKKLFYDYILPKIKEVEKLIAVRAVIVFVEPDNEQGIGFYTSLGFEKAEQIVQKAIDDSFNEKCDLYILSLI